MLVISALLAATNSAHACVSNAEETPDNGTDEDCDGADGIVQRYVEPFGQPIADPLQWSGVATFGTDVATVPGGSNISTAGPDWTVGAIFATVDANVTGTCELRLRVVDKAGTIYLQNTTLVTGSNTYSFPSIPAVDYPLKIERIRLACLPASSMDVDWLVLQNGEYVYAPAEDLDITWRDTEAPQGGYHTSVRQAYHTSGAPTVLYGTSDVGGFGRFDADIWEWEAINGSYPDWAANEWTIKAWDILQLPNGDLLGLTGTLEEVVGDQNVRGALLHSTDEGLSWVSVTDTTDPTVPVGAQRRLHRYGSKDHTGGRLLERAYGGAAFIVNHSVGGDAVVLRDASGNLCSPFGTTLPKPTSMVLNAGIYQTSDVVGALQYYSHFDASGSDPATLYVGYRTPGDTTPGLYACDIVKAPTCPAAFTCTPVTGTEGIDVADLEMLDEHLFVADYGRRDSAAGDIIDPGVWRLDTNVYTGEPTGAPDLIAAAYDFETTWGAMQNPSGLVVDPADDFLYAFTGGGRDAWHSEYPRIWRIEAADALVGAPTWIPLNEDGSPLNALNAKPNGELARGADPMETYIADQELPANWAALYDGTWFTWTGEQTETWLAGAADIGIWGWFDVRAPLLDGYLFLVNDDTSIEQAYLDNAGNGGVTTWQSTVANEGAFGSNGRVHVAVGDLAYYHQQGTARAKVPCNFELFNAGGLGAVAPGDGSVWVALHSQDDTKTSENRGILRSTDNGDTWCYQGVGDDFKYNDGGTKVQHCKLDYAYENDGDTGTDPSEDPTIGESWWTACDAGAGLPWDEQGEAFRDDSSGNPLSWGDPIDLVAVDGNMAIAAFKTYTYEKDLNDVDIPDGTYPGKLAYTVDGGATWEEVDLSGAEAECASTPTGFTNFAESFFDLNVNLALNLNPGGSYYTSATDWKFDLFVTGKDNDGTVLVDSVGSCNLYRLTFDYASRTTPTWDNLRLAFNWSGCKMIGAADIAVSPWRDELVGWTGYNRWKKGADAAEPVGGACVMNFDGTNQRSLIDPQVTGNEFDIAFMTPHPLLADTWFVVPRVLAGTGANCAKEWVSGTGWVYNEDQIFTACQEPFPFVYQLRAGTTWKAIDLEVDGLPSLVGSHLALKPAAYLAEGWIGADELLYSTATSGAHRGGISW